MMTSSPLSITNFTSLSVGRDFFNSLLVPGVRVWVVVDDTLCHKRGAKVAFGGIFLDAVLSSKRHKVFRFGNNWVMFGVIVELPFRPNRFFCLPILWRVYEKRGTKAKKDHGTKSMLAAEMVKLLAEWFPSKNFMVVADSAYIGKCGRVGSERLVRDGYSSLCELQLGLKQAKIMKASA